MKYVKMLFLVCMSGLLFFILHCSEDVQKMTSDESTIENEIQVIDKDIIDNDMNIDEFTREGTAVADVQNPESYIGEYVVYLSGINGRLVLFIEDERFHGTIEFNNSVTPVYNLTITGGKIFFIRKVDDFDQIFMGQISEDKQSFQGQYTYRGDSNNWEARKVK